MNARRVMGAILQGVIACFACLFVFMMFATPLFIFLPPISAKIIFVLSAATALILGGLTTFGALKLKQERARAQAGECIDCGYDLRESAGRCPECGKLY